MHVTSVLLGLSLVGFACGSAEDVVASGPPPEPAPSPAVEPAAFFRELPPTQLPDQGGMAGGGPRVDGRGVMLPPGGPLVLSVPDAAHAGAGVLAFTVWQVGDKGERKTQRHIDEADAGPGGTAAIELPVSADEGTAYEIEGILRAPGEPEVVWRDWAVVVPQIVSGSLELSAETVPPGGQLSAEVVNHGTVTLEYGLRYELFRWVGEDWEPFHLPFDVWAAVGLAAAPGTSGEPQDIFVPDDPGTYRVVKEVDGSDGDVVEVVLAAQFTVTDG